MNADTNLGKPWVALENPLDTRWDSWTNLVIQHINQHRVSEDVLLTGAKSWPWGSQVAVKKIMD